MSITMTVTLIENWITTQQHHCDSWTLCNSRLGMDTGSWRGEVGDEEGEGESEGMHKASELAERCQHAPL